MDDVPDAVPEIRYVCLRRPCGTIVPRIVPSIIVSERVGAAVPLVLPPSNLILSFGVIVASGDPSPPAVPKSLTRAKRKVGDAVPLALPESSRDRITCRVMLKGADCHWLLATVK